jgi:hypothetical protein
MPDLVKVVMAGKDGYTGEAERFYKSASLPDGIPAWKVWVFSRTPDMGKLRSLTAFRRSLLPGHRRINSRG